MDLAPAPTPDISSRVIVGGAVGMLGIVVGVILSAMHIDSARDLLAVRSYGHWMLVPLACAAVALLAGTAELAQAQRRRLPGLVVLVLALVAAASPFAIPIAAVAVLGGIVAMIAS